MTKQPASNRANKASIHAVIGATGSGKTSHVMQCIKRAKPQRLIIWDTKGEFAREGYAQPVTKISQVADILLKAKETGRVKIAFQPSGNVEMMKRDFSRLCYLAMSFKNCWFIAEELAEVTTAGAAPAGWRKLTTQGRSEGVTIYGLSQSPAWVDKFFWGNCTSIRTGRLTFAAHVKTMAEVMGVDKQEISDLPDLHYIHMTTSPKVLTRGKITF